MACSSGADFREDLRTDRGRTCTTGCRASPRSIQDLKPRPKLTGIVEQIPDVLVPEMVEQLVKLPKTVSVDRIQQRIAEHIAVIPVPQGVKELVVVFRVFSQDRIQERTVEQTIPVTSLAETIVVVPVIQMQGTTQRGANTHVQHVVNAVEVEKSEIIVGDSAENEAYYPGEDQQGDQAHQDSTGAVLG